MLATQKKVAASISAELGQHSLDSRDYVNAIKFYREAASHDDSDGKVRCLSVPARW